MSPCFCTNEQITLSISEWNTLKAALIQADEQLTKSEAEIQTLKEQLQTSSGLVTTLRSQSQTLEAQLNVQNSQLETLTKQLNEAWTSLQKSKNAIITDRVIMIIVGTACLALGGVVGYLIGGR